MISLPNGFVYTMSVHFLLVGANECLAWCHMYLRQTNGCHKRMLAMMSCCQKCYGDLCNHVFEVCKVLSRKKEAGWMQLVENANLIMAWIQCFEVWRYNHFELSRCASLFCWWCAWMFGMMSAWCHVSQNLLRGTNECLACVSRHREVACVSRHMVAGRRDRTCVRYTDPFGTLYSYIFLDMIPASIWYVYT